MNDFHQTLAAFEKAYHRQQSAGRQAPPAARRVSLGLEQAMMACWLDAPLGAYYNGSAEAQIDYQLRAQLFRSEHFPDYFMLYPGVCPDLGAALTASILGVPWVSSPDKEPWARHHPPISQPADLLDRPLLDFATVGMMPHLLRLYAEMQALVVGTSLQVGFPDWCRGPLGQAFYLAGAEPVLMSMYDDRGFFLGLMRYGMDVMAHWCDARAAFLGEPLPAWGTLWNDEVSAENFPPELYLELVAPFDREMFARFSGGIDFHSCGNTTPLMEAIASVAPWKQFHVSAWSDLDTALRVFPTTPLIVCLHPYSDVLGCDFSHTAQRIRDIIARCGDHPFTLAITELMPVNGPQQDLQRVLDVWALCRELFA